MARRKKGWRGRFLRVLGQTGNVRVSAREAGVNPSTAYNHRTADSKFWARWEKAKAKARARRESGNSPRTFARHGGGELVPRRSKRHGLQMVRAAAGRWSPRVEQAFLEAMELTCCTRRAAAAAGISTTALYRRRRLYPDFAGRWAAAEERAGERIPGLLASATIASLDPELDEAAMPKVSIDQAIAIARLKGLLRPSAAAAGQGEPDIEAVREDVIERLTALRRKQEEQEGG